MQFQKDAEVFSMGDQPVGHFDRVVMDPRTKEITHLVIRKGVLLAKDRVLPIHLVSTTNSRRVRLRVSADDVDQLPEYEAQFYVPIEDEDLPPGALNRPSFYWYPLVPPSHAPAEVMLPGYRVETERNIPEDTVALRVGARVVGADGEAVGQIHQVFTRPASDQVSSFVVSRGVLVKEYRSVPVSWVKSVTDEEVRVDVPAARVDAQPTFQPTHP